MVHKYASFGVDCGILLTLKLNNNININEGFNNKDYGRVTVRGFWITNRPDLYFL
jgi:hypothetical protein